MSVVWHKIWRDLAHNKTRTVLVVLSTATGLFALRMVFGMRDAVRSWPAEDYPAAAPAHVTLSNIRVSSLQRAESRSRSSGHWRARRGDRV
jgi:hypothetical protein